MRSDMKKAYYHQLGPENICRCADCRNYCARGKAADHEGGPVSCLPWVDREAGYQIRTGGRRI